MEGYLLKKGRGDSNFGRRNWKKRWFVLEGTELKYYDDVDKNFQPVGLKGTTDVKGCEVSAFDHKDKQFCFYVKPKVDSAITFQAMDQKSFNAWIKAIKAASEEEDEPDIGDDYKLLGLSMDANPDAAEVNRAFRKAALRSHPDKGGDMAEFKKFQDAFNRITAILEEEEQEKSYKYITYTCIVTKNAGETGLGLIVIEDAAKKTIKIKSILPAVKAEEFSAEAKGRMLVGDVLIGVGVENVERMPLTRVGQKLNETRVPAGSRVKLTFRRRLYLDGREVGADTASENADEATGTEGPQPPSPSNPPAQDGEFDIDETIRTFPEEEGGDAGEEGAEEGEAGDEEPTASSAAHPHGHAASGLSSGAGAVATPASGRAAASGGAAKRPSVSRGSVGQVQLLSENEELKAELFLAKDDVDSMRQTLQSLQLENEQLKHHVQRQASSLATDSLRQQAYLPHIVRQVATAEHVHNLRLHLQEVTQYVLTQQTLPVGAELEAYLTAEQLSLTECAVDVQKLAQRGAISALALGDVSGKALYRWQQQGDSAAAKLRRFADKMNTLSLPSS